MKKCQYCGADEGEFHKPLCPITQFRQAQNAYVEPTDAAKDTIIARLTRERDELQHRLERWQRNEVQIATNQQVARLIRERDEARAENERLRETNEAIKRVTHAWRVDAERYRWLKTFALYRNEHDAGIQFFWPQTTYKLDADAAIDAAREYE